MSKQILIPHAIYHVDKPVGLAIQIRLVNLLNITRKHHLGSLSGTRYNGFDFVRSKVLRLVNDAISLAQATSLFCISSRRFTSLELEAN